MMEKIESLPGALVSTDWLHANLRKSNLRIYDCTVYLHAWKDGSGQTPESGIEHWRGGHIPGSGFLDLIAEFSEPSEHLNFLVPSAESFAQAAAQHGIGLGTQVVLYDRALNRWAARIWWMLRAFGFDAAAVLDGGWSKWVREGRPVTVDSCAYRYARFSPVRRPRLIVDRDQVRSAMNKRRVHMLNALTSPQHRGTGGVHYGRRGHIPGSVNVSARDLVDAETHAYLPRTELRRYFSGAGVLDGRPIITYCGSGIAASSVAFVLSLLGVSDVALYANSLQEWAPDPQCPMEQG